MNIERRTFPAFPPFPAFLAFLAFLAFHLSRLEERIQKPWEMSLDGTENMEYYNDIIPHKLEDKYEGSSDDIR
ncbi:MAG: hypothetical protein JRJ75_14615 [Deltaproteobacteria bacterium]|nr:hypothetical protein [Deltaproteobacteria bacterium]MBW1928998.1 hypothetical protein [Deltaproteobacteria bacterium]